MHLAYELILLIFDLSSDQLQLNLLQTNHPLAKNLASDSKMIKLNVIAHITNHQLFGILTRYIKSTINFNKLIHLMVISNNKLLTKINHLPFSIIIPLVPMIKNDKLLIKLFHKYASKMDIYSVYLKILFKNHLQHVKFIRNVFDYINSNNLKVVTIDQLFAMACDSDLFYLAKILINDHRLNPGHNSNNCLITACLHNHHQIVNMLLKKSKSDPRINPGDKNNECLKWISKYNYSGLMKMFIKCSDSDNRINLSCDENDFLRTVCMNNNYQILKLLLKRAETDFRINPSAKNNQSFLKACELGHYHIVKLLLNYSKFDKRINPGEDNSKALYLSVINKRSLVLKKLLEFSHSDRRLNVNSNNGSCLISACYSDNIEIVRMILSRFRNKYLTYEDALIVVCENGSLEILDLFIYYGFNIENNIIELLSKASANNNQSIIKRLVNYSKLN